MSAAVSQVERVAVLGALLGGRRRAGARDRASQPSAWAPLALQPRVDGQHERGQRRLARLAPAATWRAVGLARRRRWSRRARPSQWAHSARASRSSAVELVGLAERVEGRLPRPAHERVAGRARMRPSRVILVGSPSSDGAEGAAVDLEGGPGDPRWPVPRRGTPRRRRSPRVVRSGRRRRGASPSIRPITSSTVEPPDRSAEASALAVDELGERDPGDHAAAEHAVGRERLGQRPSTG